MDALEYLQSPCGIIAITACSEGVTSVKFVEQPEQAEQSNQHTEKTKTQLIEYLEGSRTHFDLILAPKGTSFQKSVWKALLTVDFGKTASYLDIACAIGNSNACRAVGAANGRNPISIIVPCHRVIGSSGKLTGYAGGLARKQWLLDHEQSS